jgi:hypothetical protein
VGVIDDSISQAVLLYNWLYCSALHLGLFHVSPWVDLPLESMFP